MTEKNKSRRYLVTYACYLLAILVFSSPVFFMVWSSFRNNIDITGSIFNVAAPLTIDNYVELFDRFHFVYYVRNSFIVAGGSTIIGLLLGVPAAYVIVRRNLQAASFFTLLARMAPGVMFVLPLFILSVRIGAPATTYSTSCC